MLAAAASVGLAGCTGGGSDTPTIARETATGPPPTLPDVAGAWTHPRGDAAGTRFVADGSVPARPPRAAWTAESDAEWSHVLVADGAVYVRSTVGVVALDARTGERRWRWTVDGDDDLVAMAVGDAVYVAAGRTVTALSPADGSTLWRGSTDRNDVKQLAAVGDTVYVTTDGARDAAGGVVALAGGGRRWRYLPEEVDVSRFDSLAVDDDTVVAAGQNVGGTGWHVALDRATGERRWFTPGVTNSRALTLVDGALVAGGLHGTVMVQSVDDGAKRWRRDVGPGVEAVATDGETAFVAGKDEDGDNCRAVSLSDGTERWSSPVGRTALGAGDRVVVAGDGRVRALATGGGGDVQWERRTGTVPRGLALADGVLFSVGPSGTLRALTA